MNATPLRISVSAGLVRAPCHDAGVAKFPEGRARWEAVKSCGSGETLCLEECGWTP
ncbi:MAG TPA: hypothetical protein VLT33_15380 [Labilithrix sp.]|nr:hypothetical protein [Labilithrix sp.]